MNDLDFYITRHLQPSQGEWFRNGICHNDDTEWDKYREYEWTFDPTEVHEIVDESPPSRDFPRVVPPIQRNRRAPMAHDGGPGVQDHSRIKHLLREWL